MIPLKELLTSSQSTDASEADGCSWERYTTRVGEGIRVEDSTSNTAARTTREALSSAVVSPSTCHGSGEHLLEFVEEDRDGVWERSRVGDWRRRSVS